MILGKPLQLEPVLSYLFRRVSLGYHQTLQAPSVCVPSPPLASVSMPQALPVVPLSSRLQSASEGVASLVVHD